MAARNMIIIKKTTKMHVSAMGEFFVGYLSEKWMVCTFTEKILYLHVLFDVINHINITVTFWSLLSKRVGQWSIK